MEKKMTNKAIVLETAAECRSKGLMLHWIEFRQMCWKAGAKTVREDWIRKFGADRAGVDEKFLHAMKPVTKRFNPTNEKPEYTCEQIMDAVLWQF